MAHIEKKMVRTGSRYYVRFMDPSGKRATEGGFRLKKDAEAALKRIEAEIASGNYGIKDAPLFEDFYETWIRTKRGNLKASTLASYENTYRLHILPAFTGKRLAVITPLEIQDWITGLSGKGLSAGTVGRCYRYLRACLKQAENWDIIKRSPCRSINLPRTNHDELSFLDPREINRLLSCAVEPERDLVALLAWSGLRLGEGLALAWRHIDFESNAVIVERAWSYWGGFQEPKTSGSRRAVPMLPILRVHLQELYRSHGEPLPDTLLFSHDGEKPLDPSNVRRDFEAALKRAGLKHVTLHSLRHTYASASLSSGCSIKALQRSLGHASATMTLNTYSHLIQEDHGRSLMRTSALFEGGEGEVILLADSRTSRQK